MSKAFGVVQEVKDWLRPLASALKSNAFKLEKGELKLQLTAVKEGLQKAKKEALTKTRKAYELTCNYFVSKA